MLWLTGGIVRLQSPLSPQYLPQLAAMTLFHPASMIVIWLGWKTGLRLADLVTAFLVATFSYGLWNGIMLPGLPWDLVGKTLMSNAIHWSLYLSVGFVVARYVQWGTSIGIWAESKKARGAPKVAPARLSINKLFLLMTIAAGAAVAYQSLALQPNRAFARTSQLDFFPVQLKPVISAIIGGSLVSLHWLTTILILKSRSFRLAGLILMFPCLMFLRWFPNALYWDAPLSFPGTDALDSGAMLELDGRRYASYVLDFSTPYPALAQSSVGWNVYAVEAIVQLALILISIQWFRLIGFRVDFWRSIHTPPAPSGASDNENRRI